MIGIVRRLLGRQSATERYIVVAAVHAMFVSVTKDARPGEDLATVVKSLTDESTAPERRRLTQEDGALECLGDIAGHVVQR